MIKLKNNKILLISTFLILVIAIVGTTIIANHWHDTRWGGDAGTEEYSIPPVPVDPPEEESDVCGTGCYSVIVCIGILPIAMVVSKWDEIVIKWNNIVSKWSKKHE